MTHLRKLNHDENVESLYLNCFCNSIFFSYGRLATLKTVSLDGYNNTVPGGNLYYETNVASGVYRFRIDSASVGIDYATGQAGNTNSKSAALRTYDRTTTADKTASVSYYGLNNDGLQSSSLIHAFPQGGGFDLYLEDWQRADDSGSVNVIIEKWQN